MFADTRTEVTNTQRQMSIATQLVDSCGVLTRELVTSRGLPGGFSSVYPVLKAMEESGRVRRGYFVAGLGATQFAAPGADDRLRSKKTDDIGDNPETHVIASTDPANVYGTALRWPQTAQEGGLRPSRTTGSRVIICDGVLVGYLGKTTQHLLTFLPETEPLKTRLLQAMVRAIVGLADSHTPVFLTQIDGVPANQSVLSESFQTAGFVHNHQGLLLRRTRNDSDA